MTVAPLEKLARVVSFNVAILEVLVLMLEALVDIRIIRTDICAVSIDT